MEVYELERPSDRGPDSRRAAGSRAGGGAAEQHPSGIWNLAIPDSDIGFSSLPDIGPGSPNDTDDRVMCPDIGPGVCIRAEQAVIVLA